MDLEGMQHQYPVNDEQEHVLSDFMRCPCNPQIVKNAYGVIICLHSAFDMRHLIAQAERIRLVQCVKVDQEPKPYGALVLPIFYDTPGPFEMPLAFDRGCLPVVQDEDEGEMT